MKNMRIACLLAALASPLNSYAEPVRMSDENAYIYYESRAEIQAPKESLAGYISKDYRNSRDEFTKYDLFEKIKPVLNKKLAEAKLNNSITLNVRGNLGDYDFSKKSFPTGFGETTFIPFDHGYAVNFTNGTDIEFIDVPMASARTLSSSLQRSRSAVFTIQGEIVGAEEQQVNSWSTKKMIKVKITSIDVKLKSGTSVGSKSL